MGNDVNIKIEAVSDVPDVLKKIEGSATHVENVIVRTMGTSEEAFQSSARASGKVGDALDQLSGASSQLSGGMGDLADGLQAVTDFQNRGAERARELARKEIDVEQAMEDTQQAAEDLAQAHLDLNQSMLDGKQSQVDFEQSQIDQEQALVDASVAQKDYNDAVKEYGPKSDEARQAAVDLSQAQADLKQANLDADQAIADQAQATADGAQATRDMNQATIDAKSSQVDLNEAQSNAKAPTQLQSWTTELATFAPLVAAATGAIDLMILANKMLTAEMVKNTAVQAGQKIATIAGTVATGIATAAQWLWNFALTANPIGLVIVGIIALIGVIIFLATKTTFFQDLWRIAWGIIKATALGIWNPIKSAAQSFWDYIKKVWDYMLSIPGKLKSAFDAVTNFITAPFRAAFNYVSRAWNGTIGQLHWSVPDWVPGIGGNSFSAPRLPTFHTGGDVLRTGVAVLRQGERVLSADKAGGAGGAGGTITLVIDMTSAPADLRRWIKSMTSLFGGRGANSAQIAWAGDA